MVTVLHVYTSDRVYAASWLLQRISHYKYYVYSVMVTAVIVHISSLVDTASLALQGMFITQMCIHIVITAMNVNTTIVLYSA